MKRQIFAASALVLAACLPQPAYASQSPAPVAAPSAWHSRADEAFAAARKSGKPVLVDLFAQWCGWCKTMEREVFNQERFQSYSERFVLLRVDVEDGGDGSDLQRRFSANSLPTLLLLDPKQALLGKIEGFMETERLIARLDRELKVYDAFLASYESALASKDPTLWRSRAQELHARGDGGRAAVLFERVLRAGSLSGDELAWTRLQLADAYRIDGRFADAKRTAADLRSALAKNAPSPQSPGISERVDLLLIFIAGGEGDCVGAAGALAAFERGHPGSPYLADARRAYSVLKSDTAAQCS
jgi:thiol-disulfide isomerase/thioredoxin